MTSDTGEREEIELMMPWYATGRLDTAERERVERWLAAHPDDHRLVALAEEEAAAAVAASEAVAAPAPRVLERLMGEIDASRRPGTSAGAARLWQRGVDWLAGLAPERLAAAGAAALVLLLLQAAAIGALYLKSQAPARYNTASGPARKAEGGTFALVAFVPTAGSATVTALLSQIGAEIVEGPKAGGLYRIRLSEERLEPERAEAIVARLRSRRDVVAFASAAGEAD